MLTVLMIPFYFINSAIVLQLIFENYGDISKLLVIDNRCPAMTALNENSAASEEI